MTQGDKEKKATKKKDGLLRISPQIDAAIDSRTLVDQAIKQNLSKEQIIEERREANKKICNNAKSILQLRGQRLQGYDQRLINAAAINGNFDEERQLIKQILAEHEKIEGFILVTRDNLSKHVSLRSDKTIDKEKNKGLDRNRFMSTSIDLPTKYIITGGQTFNADDKKRDEWSYDMVPSREQLKDELKRTKQTTKIWQGLSKIQGDDDRSKGYAALSDNLASMAMTGINTGKQGMALAQALLEYAVVDVLYTSLVKGTLKGAAKGFKTGYSGTNKGIKSAANVMYVMMDRSEKNLEKVVNEVYDKHVNKLGIENNKEWQDRTTREKANKILSALREIGESDELTSDIQLLDTAITNARQYEPTLEAPPKSNLATTGAAALGGVVGGVVVGITNAIWEGVKNPALAVTVKVPQGLKTHYKKPEQGKSWNRNLAQVKQEIKSQRIESTQEKYAKRTEKEGKFTKMVQKKKLGTIEL